MSEDEEKKSSFKVTDRRRVDSDGNDREGDAPPRPQPDMSSQPVAAERQGANTGPEITFGSFVISLATQALMQLGEMPPPEGMQLPQDKEGARQTIEIIAMLERKTRNNLDGDEQRLVAEVLHSLRLSYVRATS